LWELGGSFGSRRHHFPELVDDLREGLILGVATLAPNQVLFSVLLALEPLHAFACLILDLLGGLQVVLKPHQALQIVAERVIFVLPELALHQLLRLLQFLNLLLLFLQSGLELFLLRPSQGLKLLLLDSKLLLQLGLELLLRSLLLTQVRLEG